MLRTTVREAKARTGGEIKEIKDRDGDDTDHEGNQGEALAGTGVTAAPSATALDWHGRIKPENKEELRQVWERLKQTVEELPHVGCYSVASLAYRR